MEMTLVRPRAHRFVARKIEGDALTDRDLAVLVALWRHRIADSDQLALLDGGNRSNLRVRLRHLYDPGLIGRPEQSINKHMRYWLTTKGARRLKDEGYRINNGIDWNERNKRAGFIFREHTHAVATFLVALEVACQDAGIEFIR